MRLFDDVVSRVDDPFLGHALALAERARGATSPNPLVGCVVVREGQIVGEGFHPRAGEAHAEVFALVDAGDAARGADVYVTLEPCSHHGRTPPCTDALIRAGVSRVVIGMRDPNAEAAGGAEVLRQAGIVVEFASDAEAFAVANEAWLKRIATGLPFVTAKIALSLDGHGVLVPGERASITGEAGARVTRRLRRQSDAVLVGSATVGVDDPALTVRDSEGALAERQPARVILCGSSLPPADAQVLNDGLAPTILLVPAQMAGATVSVADHVTFAQYDAATGLSSALGELARRGIAELLVEPGPRLLTSMWEQGVLDALVTVTAGGMAGPDAPAGFLGRSDGEGDVLSSALSPLEVGIVGNVSVTQWRPDGDAARV